MKNNLQVLFSFLTGGYSVTALVQKSTPFLAWILLVLSIISIAVIIRMNWKTLKKIELEIENKEIERDLKETFLDEITDKEEKP